MPPAEQMSLFIAMARNLVPDHQEPPLPHHFQVPSKYQPALAGKITGMVIYGALSISDFLIFTMSEHQLKIYIDATVSLLGS